MIFILLLFSLNSNAGEIKSYLVPCDTSQSCSFKQIKTGDIDILTRAICEVPNSDHKGDDYQIVGNVCTFDPALKQIRLDAKKAKDGADKVKADKKKSDLDAICASPKAGWDTIHCEERGY